MPPIIQGGKTAKALQTPGHLRRPPRQNLQPMLTLTSSLTLACPSAHHTAFGLGMTTTWGLTLTLGRPPSSPSQGVCPPKTGNLLPLTPSTRGTLMPAHNPGTLEGHQSFRAGEWAGPSKCMATFEGPACQNPWAHARTPQRPHLGPPLRSPHNPPLWPAVLLRANPNPRSALKSPIPSGRGKQCWELGTLGPHCQTYPLSMPPPGQQGAANHSGRDNGQGPLSHQLLPRPTMPKALGPHSPSWRLPLNHPLCSLHSPLIP